MRKPVVMTKCVANAYTSDDERIVEFYDVEADFDNRAGGLISLRRLEDGLRVELYRLDNTVKVRVPFENLDPLLVARWKEKGLI